MKKLSDKFKYAEYYTFEDYIRDNHIQECDITDNTHLHYITTTWSIVFHRPYYRYRSHVYETLLSSFDTKGLYNEIVKHFGNDIVKDYDIYKDKVYTKSLIIYYKNDKFVESDEFKSILNRYNYFLTYNNTNEKTIHLEPYMPDKRTDYIYNDCKGIVYHITNSRVYEKIKKYGLKPQTASYRKYPSRVFVVAHDDKTQIKDQIQHVIDILKDDEIFKNYSMIILKIDLNKYHNKLDFFVDNGMNNNSFFTKEYIPPFCIERTFLNKL